jgi:hypothetical protein
MSILELKESDKRRWVAYTPRGQPHATDIGQIQSWNHAYAWVLFPFRERPHWDTIGERKPVWCLSDALRFVERRPDGGFDL